MMIVEKILSLFGRREHPESPFERVLKLSAEVEIQRQAKEIWENGGQPRHVTVGSDNFTVDVDRLEADGKLPNIYITDHGDLVMSVTNIPTRREFIKVV